ncbi:MAG: biotin--[acetyl-CoA-carboxylase] ligase [Chitinophagaceae bacterium]
MSYPTTANPIGQPLTILPSVDSTNNYAMGQVQTGAAGHGAAWLAMEQTAGKGQRGRSWVTSFGENILFSVVLAPPAQAIGHPFLLSATVALACYDFFNIYAGDETRIKWPNDLYWRDRKAAGILIENTYRGKEWLFAIAGMGININQVRFEGSRNPVSLRQITGKEFDVTTLVKELCLTLENRYRQLQSDTSGSILADYHKVLYKMGETVKLKKANSIFETTISGVSAAGKLLTQDTLERSFDVGEVEWVL